MNKNVSIKVVLDKRRVKKDNRYPIKVRITHQRYSKYYYTGYDASVDEWSIIHSENAEDDLLDIKTEITNNHVEIKKIIKNIKPFSFEEFEDEYFDKPVDAADVYEAYDRYIRVLDANDQDGTLGNYEESKVSLLKFSPSLRFDQVTPFFLRKYEEWMITTEGNALSTVGIYLRPLRALFNQAIENKVIKADKYPFLKGKYTLPIGVRGKIPLTAEEIRLIVDYQAEPYSQEDRAKDFWLFSYFSNGMNFKDILELRNKQVNDDTFMFERLKSKRTRRENPFIIEVILNEYTKNVISKWGIGGTNSEDLVFPFLDGIRDNKRRRDVRKQFIKQTNKYIKRICLKVGIYKKVTTYVARHSFAHAILNNGGTTEHVQEFLGHSDIRTTQNYTRSGIDPRLKRELVRNL